MHLYTLITLGKQTNKNKTPNKQSVKVNLKSNLIYSLQLIMRVQPVGYVHV